MAMLVINPPTNIAINFTPSTVIGGNAANGTISITQPPTAPISVQLTSDNPAAQPPGSVQIDSGNPSVAFTVPTSVVTSAQIAHITASYQGSSVATALEIDPQGSLVAVAVQINGIGTVTSSPAGINCSSGTCTAQFAQGAQITLTANVPGGSSLSWSGDCASAGGSTTVTFTLAGNESCTASFIGSSGSTSLIGRVVSNNVPVGGARVELKAATGSYPDLPVLASAITASDGTFVVQDPPIGTFALFPVAPAGDGYPEANGEYWDWGASVTVTSVTGRQVDAGALNLPKVMQLVSPSDYSSIDTTSPTLQWVAFPGASYYNVFVSDDVTLSNLFFRSNVTGTQVTVLPGLGAPTGHYYQWGVYAYNAQGTVIAYYSAWLFRIVL